MKRIYTNVARLSLAICLLLDRNVACSVLLKHIQNTY